MYQIFELLCIILCNDEFLCLKGGWNANTLGPKISKRGSCKLLW